MGNDRPEQELHVSDLDNNIVNCEIGKGDFRCDNLHHLRACLGIMNEGHWGGGISIISQNFSKSPSILFHPLKSSISKQALTLRLVTISKESVHGILGCCLGSPADVLSAMA
jgi:hypothetical protein